MEQEKYAAIYIRVSTDAQREEGYSIEAQKEMLKAHCVSKGIKKYEFYIDGGFTGSNIDRPEMQRLISDVKEEKISYVIVYKLDRLSRSQKDTLYLIEDVFNPHNVDFVSINESMDTSTPLGRLMLGILSAFAQLERENIRERTRMGMKERVKSGLWMGGGRVPFGYDYNKEKGVLVPNKDADRVRKIYELYLNGYTISKITEMVGLKYDKLAYQILTRKSNAGFICYNGEEYLGQHEPIIDLDTYEKAMYYMKERSVKKVFESNYLFTGLLHCGKCGAKMRYQKWGKNDCKITCYSNDKHKPHLVKDPNCDNLKLWASDVEDLIIKNLFEYSYKQSNSTLGNITNIRLIDMLHDQYNAVTTKLKRLYNLYSENGDEILLQTINSVKKEMRNIQKQIEIEIGRMQDEKNFLDIQKSISNLYEAWEYMTPKERKKIINSCIDKITITDREIDVNYKFEL